MANTVWVLVNPASSPLLLFLIQLALTLVVTRVLGKLFSYAKQPLVVGEIVAGIIMGPSVMGHIPGYTATIWPTAVYITPTHYYDSVQTFYVIASIGLILFMFMMGMELDQQLLTMQWKISLPIAVSAIIFPFGIGAASSVWLYQINAEDQPADWTSPTYLSFCLFAGAAMSFTAFPVLASILSATGLIKTPIGVQAMCCAAVDDILAWCTLAVASSFAVSSVAINGLFTCLLAAGYIVTMLTLVRPAMEMLHRWVQGCNSLDNRYYTCFIFLLLIASAFMTEMIGIHSFFGAFIIGLLVPKGGGYADNLVKNMGLVISEVLLPMYFANSGIRTNIGSLNTIRYWGITLAIIVIACIAKFVPACTMTKLITKRNWRFCVTMGILMNTRGLVEVIALNVGLSSGILSPRLFTMLILMAIATTLFTSPLTYFVYQRHQALVDTQEVDNDTANPVADASGGSEKSEAGGMVGTSAHVQLAAVGDCAVNTAATGAADAV